MSSYDAIRLIRPTSYLLANDTGAPPPREQRDSWARNKFFPKCEIAHNRFAG